MKHSLPNGCSAKLPTTAVPSLRWWHFFLITLLLSGPGAWAQTYLIGTNQTTCAGTIYDSGGATGNYSNNEDLTSVLTPATAGSKVALNFTAFSTEVCCDYLRIYDGPTATAPLLGEFRGTTSPGSVYATNATGQLTLVFHSDGSVVNPGFAATVGCITNVPSITSFTPTSGPVGTSVVITGTFFTGATDVSFNNVPATVFTVNSATQITATVPTGATTGPIRVTNVVTATSATSFTVPAPTITSFTPTSGPAGTVVTVTGTGFTGATTVTLGGTPITGYTVVSGTQLTFTVPAGAYSGPIVVTTPAGTATSTGTYNTGNAAYLIGTNQTTCTGILFDSGGPTGSYSNNENLTTVLTPGTAGAKVKLDFTAFSTESGFDFLMIYDGATATAPLLGSFSGTTSPGIIIATNTTGQLTLVFTSDGSVTGTGFAAAISCVTNVPSITSFTPTSGPVGTSVVITGTDFTGATAVRFNTTNATVFTVNSATQITATVPTGATTGPIRITTPITTAISATNFTVPAPTITSFTPTSGPAGTVVTVTGTGFTGATTVTLGGTPITGYTVVSGTQLTFTVPAGAYSGPIVVTTPAGTGTSTGTYNTGNMAYLIGTNQTTCSGILFDSGGANGDYSNSENLTSVLTPANGSKVVLTFTAFDLENSFDFLRIYDGPTAAAPLLGAFTGTTSPGTITASTANTTGQLTLVFTSDGSVTRAGFAATISCLAPPTCTLVTNLTVTNVTSTAATLNFTPGIGNNSYVVTYTPTGGTAQTTTGTASPITLTGLVPSTPYTISVQPVCTVGTSPNTVTNASFTTLLPNDEPCGAVTLSVVPVTGSNVGATTSVQPGIRIPACAPANILQDVWYVFTATATAHLITVTGAPAGQLRVFTAADCANGPFVSVICRSSGANNTAVGPVTVTGLTVGASYYAAVSNYGGTDASGLFTIALNTISATQAQAEASALVVYPNPSNTGELTLRLSGLSGSGKAMLLNALGQVVLTHDLPTTTIEQTLHTGALAAGVYTLRVAVAGQILTRKVVLQ